MRRRAPRLPGRTCPRSPRPEPPAPGRRRPARRAARRTARAAGKFAERAERHHALVHGLLAEGRGIREIARHLGWGRHTVQRYARAATWQELVDGRWQATAPASWTRSSPTWTSTPATATATSPGCSARSRALGYNGSYPVVRDYLYEHQPARTPLPPAPPTVRDVTGWLTRHPDSLTGDERPRLKAILDRCPELQAASGQVRAFAAMLTELTGQDLPQWISRRPQRRPARHRVVRQGTRTRPRRRHSRPDHAAGTPAPSKAA